MDHLSGLDALFLHMESPETPMHVGSLAIFELEPGYDGNFVDDVRKHIRSRMHLAPIFQRKLVNMPFDIANPIWVMDDHLDIDYHIRHVIVPPPATRSSVDRLVSRLHSSLLDRSRPLWEMYVLDGLPVPANAPEGTRYIGLYSKMHHASLDGMGGQVLMQAIMDITPVPRTVKPARHKVNLQSDNYGIAELTASGIAHNVGQTMKLARALPTLAKGAYRALQPAKNEAEPKERQGRFAPRTPFNKTITNQRSFARFSLPLDEVKAIAKAHQVSLNDVVMTLSAEGLNRYFAEENFKPSGSLLAAIPVSLRPEGNTDLSNQVSMARMSLATNIKDPIERLKAIHANSAGVKELISDVKNVLPTDFPSLGAPWLMSAMSATAVRARVFNVMPPLANVVISNVPGPNMTLYFAGAKQISTYPVSIPFHGMGLNITLQSYNGWLDFGIISCRRLLPDIEEFASFIEDAHKDLLKRSLPQEEPKVEEQVKEAPRPKATRRAATKGARKPALSPKKKEKAADRSALN